MERILITLSLFLFPISAIVASPALTAPTIQDNTAQDTASGRAEKAGAAQSVGNQGQDTSMINGTILMTAAIPMLASPIPSVQAAGAALMVKAGLEFAQSAADGQNANTNGAQKNLLNNGDPTTDQTPTTNPDLSPLTQYLDSQGVPNSSGLADQVANGTLNPQSLLSALGVTPTADDIAAGNTLADQQLTGLLSSPPAQTTTVPNSIAPNEGADTTNGSYADNSGSGGGASPGGMGGGGAGNSAAAPESAAPSADGQAAAVQNSAFASLRGGANSIDDKSTPSASSAQFLTQFAQTTGISAPGEAATQADVITAKNVLAKLGVTTPKPTQNIFQTAHRNFHAFAKWRKQTRVAALQ